MSFPLGKPVLVMLAVAAVTGATLLWRPPTAGQADLVVWVFADSHARAYREGDPASGMSLIEQYQRRHGRSVSVTLISSRALDVRLLSMFYSQSRDVPDLAEIEIGSVGKFFRPRAGEVGFLPLNELIERDGMRGKLVGSRLMPWSKGDVVFGIPHDVHPVAITYRKDLFDEAGVDLASAGTWEAFEAKCLEFQAYWRAKGVGRWGIGLPAADADRLMVLLLQRGVNLIDNRGGIHLNDPKVLDTVVRYARMVAGPRKVAADETPGGHLWARDLARGDLGAVLAADWRITDLKGAAPELAGKCAIMPLPVWEPGDAPTSTWGGTMIGIPRHCKDPEESWRLLKWLYISEEGRRARQRYSDILPAVKTHWDDGLDEADGYFGGQQVQRLMVELAGKIPEAHITPYRGWAKEALSQVLARAVDHLSEHGEAGLVERCRASLDEMAGELRRYMERGEVR
jgi:ABC-type glycerol-3-phosphate transport system substrate-binding protein